MSDKQKAKHQRAKKDVHVVTERRVHYQMLAIKEQLPGSPKANIFPTGC